MALVAALDNFCLELEGSGVEFGFLPDGRPSYPQLEA